MKAIHKYIKFIGQYPVLKKQGYEFQRLYAGNYMQWAKSGTRIWKKGAEVTIDSLTNYEGSFFELFLKYKREGKELPFNVGVMNGNKSIRFFKNTKTYTVSLDENEALIAQEKAFMKYCSELEEKFPTPEAVQKTGSGSTMRMEWNRATEEKALASGIVMPEHIWEVGHISLDKLNPLIELVNLGWVALTEIEIDV